MGMMYTEITLKNLHDENLADNGVITDSEVRQVTVKAIVNTETVTLTISEAIRQKLGLKITGKRRSTLTDDTALVYEVTEPVSIHWKDPESPCKAFVLPNLNKALLGAIPMEDIDLIVNPVKQELVDVYGDEMMTYL